MVKFIEKKVSQIIAVSEAGLAATRPWYRQNSSSQR